MKAKIRRPSVLRGGGGTDKLFAEQNPFVLPINQGEVDLNVNAGFFIVAVLAGFVIPFLAHTLPSRKALAKSLNTAIDISRHKQSEMKVPSRRAIEILSQIHLLTKNGTVVGLAGARLFGKTRESLTSSCFWSSSGSFWLRLGASSFTEFLDHLTTGI